MSGSTIALGGKVDEATNYIEPTILVDIKPTDPAMQDEVHNRYLNILS